MMRRCSISGQQKVNVISFFLKVTFEPDGIATRELRRHIVNQPRSANARGGNQARRLTVFGE